MRLGLSRGFCGVASSAGGRVNESVGKGGERPERTAQRDAMVFTRHSAISEVSKVCYARRVAFKIAPGVGWLSSEARHACTRDRPLALPIEK